MRQPGSQSNSLSTATDIDSDCFLGCFCFAKVRFSLESLSRKLFLFTSGRTGGFSKREHTNKYPPHSRGYLSQLQKNPGFHRGRYNAETNRIFRDTCPKKENQCHAGTSVDYSLPQGLISGACCYFPGFLRTGKGNCSVSCPVDCSFSWIKCSSVIWWYTL